VSTNLANHPVARIAAAKLRDLGSLVLPQDRAGRSGGIDGSTAPVGAFGVATADAGVETLRRMASVDRYNDWIYSRIEDHVGRRVLEVGCGLGNMTPYFLGRDRLVAIDVLRPSVEQVRARYGREPNFRAYCADICAEETYQRLGSFSFDTVVCLNVLEHIRDDAVALRHMAGLLEPGGKLLLFVPAGQYLYGKLDAALLHHRRYDAAALGELVERSGLNVETLGYMNPAGIPGWFLASRVLGRSTPPRLLLGLFNLLTPAFRLIEERVEMPVGLSLICVASRSVR
jgi:SAM-dependent methyltransferase